MARLIPRKQVEEVQDFIRDTSFAGNVTISGSLLVSQSFSFGNNPDTKSDITGSVFITGSLTLDGPLNVVGDQALNLTASVALDSIDTRLFGGIRPEDFGANESTLYVSAISGDDNNDGRTPQFPLKTIKKAAELATAGDDGRFGLPDSDFSGFRIEVAAGTYRENNPIELPRNTTVWGAGLRVSKIVALNENEDLFWVNSGCYLAEMTFAGLRVFPSVDNARSGFAIAFAPNAFITTSPYIQNCSMISNQENSFKELYEDIPAGGGGLNVDGNRIHPDSPLASMVLDAYTQVAPNGVGCQVVGRGFIQLVSFFTNFSAYAVKVLDGGQAVLLNSNTSFGDYGMYASGSRFITGSGGNGDAFASVRDNYTIIVDTIEDGLSAIPEFVPNTQRGIKTTSELQKFISGNSSNEVAEQAKSEYRLVSNIVSSGISNIPSLLAKSATRGYNTGSVWNISYGIQTTGSITASSSELTILSDNFDKVKETLEFGNRITASYELVDNIEGLIKVSDETQTAVGFASSQDTINSVSYNFDKIISIVKNGTTLLPELTSSNAGNIKVTDTDQFITDISSSAEVQSKISSSFSIVHDILLRGTGSAPTIIQSGSENETIDYQNGYEALIGNIPFIQEEVISYISSSWSTFDYDEVKCKRDVGYIVSGAAHDLLYGGNEESIRNGNFYYLFPSEATGSQLQQTLDAIRYASGLAVRLVGDITYQEPSIEQLNAYEGIVNNKTFIQEEVISYISSSWRNFDYDEVKCKRDVGYILDAIATDVKYGGNERSIIAGKFYYDYPSEATTTQLLQTTDGIQYAKDVVTKILEAETFTSPSSTIQSVYDLIVENRSLIQEETVNFIDTQFPNLVYLRDKCKRDTGYIVDAIATDLLYGGNQKSVRAGLYYGEVPSKVNGAQLNETIDGISYVKTFIDKIVTNEIIESPGVVNNTTARIQAGNIDFITSSVSGTESERIKVSSSFGLVEDIIKQGEDSLLAAIAGNTPNFNWSLDEPKLVTGLDIVTSSADTTNIETISSNYGIITNIISNGVSATPSEVTNWSGSIKVTDTTPFRNESSVASSTEATLVSSSISIVRNVVQNGTDSLPILVENTDGLIKVSSEIQFTTSSVSASIDDIHFISGAFDIVTTILQEGSGSYETASLYGTPLTASNVVAAYNLIKENITFIQEETIAYLSSSWSSFDYDEDKCKRDVGYIVSGAAEDLLHGVYSASIVNGKFYLENPSNANIPNDGDTPSGAQLNQTLDGINYASRLTQKIASNITLVSPSQAVLDSKELLVENKQFIKDEVVAFVSSSWSEVQYNQDTCKRDVGYILDATITDLVYGGNERSRVASEYYYRYPSAAVVGGVPSTTQQKDPTVDAIEYLGGISEQIVLGSTFTLADSNKVSIANLIRENKSYIQQNVLDYINYNYPTLTYNQTKCYRDIGFITDAIVTDLVYGGNARSIQAGTFYYTFPSQATGYQIEETINGINYGRDLTELIIRGGKQIEDSFDVVVKIIESGSTLTSDLTIGSASNSELPVAQRGIPKDSYPTENLDTTILGTTIPAEITLVSNVNDTVRFNSGSQYTSSLSASVETSTNISESFSTVIDIIEYGITSSLVLSGSNDSSTYFEVVTLANDSTAFYITDNQLKYFDGRDGWALGGEDTGSFLGSKKDPTLTLVRNEMYNFSINDLGFEDITINEPFLIKTKRTSGVGDALQGENIINNGITFGTLTFTPLYDTPDTLYYVNPNNISASGVINIVDSLPLSAEQEYVEVPSRGQFEKVLNTTENIKISDNTQYTLDSDASIVDRNTISGSIDTVINILSSGSSVAPTIVKNIDGLIKRSSVNQVTSSFDISSTIVNKISSSVGIVLNIIENGTGSLPTQVDNTDEYIAVGTTSQFTASSISASFNDIQIISESFEIVARILENGSGSYETASLYGSAITSSTTVAGYNLLKQNIDFIQEETIAYLSSSWSTFDYDEDKCKRDVGYIVSGAAEDLIHNVYSASIVNGKFYLEYPSEATGSQLNQTLDGIRYASRLAQNIASNITYVSPSQERLNTETIIRSNIEFIKEEAITFLSSSWSAFDYNDVTCKRDIGYILDATITDIVYGGNERSINAGVFYYKYPSEATGSQLFPTVDGIQYAGEVTQKVVTGSVFSEPSSTKVTAYNLVHENRELIQDEVIQYISSSWNSFDYDDVKCRRDVGYILDAATTDLIYGGNERSVIAGDFYYRYPSQATGSQLNQTVDGIVYAQRLADKMLTNTLLVTASLERREVYDLIERNREMVQAEVISYISSSWSEFEYDDVKCSRDVGHILDAVATDLRYGGNERSVIAGEYYWRYPSEATNVQKVQTIDGIVHAANIVQKLIQNVVFETPTADKLEIWNTIRNNRTLIQNEVTEFIDYKYPFFTYNRAKCRRDVGYILDGIATDLLYGGNERSVKSGDFYYKYPSEATTIQLAETVDGIRYAESLLKNIILDNTLESPSFVLNTDGNIKVTDLEPTLSSIALSGSYQTEISSSINLITEIISGGLSYLPNVTESVDDLIKINNTTQFTSSLSGSSVEAGFVTRSVGFINDIIRFGIDDIPFTLAKWYDDTLDVPQNLTTGSYVTASGTYTTDTEFGIVSSSFGSIINVIENGTDYSPTLEYNTANNIKVTTTNQFTSSLSGSTSSITKVSASVGIVENIVQNGLSVKPTIVYNNSDTDNLIKVTDATQFTTGSFGGELQRRLISSSISVVASILENGTGSLPVYEDYGSPSDSPKTLAAYNVLKENIQFIQSESIAYLSSSWSGIEFNEASCSRDVGLIISGAAEDMLHNSVSASVVNGKFYLEYPSAAIISGSVSPNSGSQLVPTLDGIRYAGRLAEHIVKGYTFTTASNEVSASVELIRNNKQFIQDETIEFVSSSWSNFDYNQDTCKRDVGFILDAVATDLLYGGNERSVTAGDFYYRYPSAAIIGGVPSVSQQKDPTVTAIDYVQGLVTEIVGGATFQTASNEVEYVYEAIRENREFIQNETIAFVNAKYPNLDYNEASCSRDTGFIVDAVATDLRWGGNQRSREAGRFYYLFPSKATGVQVEETTDALVYTKDLIEKIVDKETLFVPSASLNTGNRIKVTDLSPAPFLDLSDPNAMIEQISASFAIVSDAILNGTGSTPIASNYGSPLYEDNAVRSHAMITASVPFIQAETIAYLSSSWSDFSYNEASCSRDVGLIVNGVAEDLLHGVVSASVVNAKFYYEYPSEATSSQAQQTVDGINYAYQLTEQILRGTTFTSPSTQISASVELIRNNREFIQSESISYLSSSWEGFEYNQLSCSRDVGHIVDAVATDLLYGGNQRSKIAGEFYYKYPSSATSTQLEPTTTGIKYAGDVTSKLVEGNVFVTASDERLAGNRVLLDNKEFISSEVIQYISSSWSDFDYNDVKCKRDVGYILNAVATDFLYGGNERSREAGRFYYEYPSEATTIQLNQTIDGINYASSLARKVMENETFVTASAEVSASVALLRTNRSFIQNETIEFISSSWSNVVYNEDKCRRDTGYIVDAAATDLLYGGNERSVTAGLYYWRYPSRATNAGTPSEQNQLDPTVDGIRFANGTAQNVVQNLEYTTPSTAVLNGIQLLRDNTTFIQKETIAYLSSSWSEFDYNEVSCSRDLGYIIDAVATDLKYGGNERAVQAGTFYYYIPSIATTEQKPQTTDGIDFAKGLAENVIKQKQLVFASFLNRESADALRAAKKTLQGKAISYTNAAFPDFVYNEEKCYRDTGFILDAIATDLIYGGNERSIRAAESYYNGVYGDASAVVNEQKYETAETNRYLRTQFQFVARKADVEEFGSLIITTGHDFSYAGSGVTYKALPPNQGGDGVPDPNKEITEIGGGRVFFTSGNELGDFRIGAGLVINQATGTLQGRTFSRSLFSLVTPFSLALQD
jgi:hypothetical protein